MSEAFVGRLRGIEGETRVDGCGRWLEVVLNGGGGWTVEGGVESKQRMIVYDRLSTKYLQQAFVLPLVGQRAVCQCRER